MKSAIRMPSPQHVYDQRSGVLRLSVKVFQHLDDFCLKWMEITAKLPGVKIVKMVV